LGLSEPLTDVGEGLFGDDDPLIDRIVGGQMVIFAFELPIDPIATPNRTTARYDARLLT
jgi:hypothetical protein